MEITLEQAKTIARALIYVNNKLASEAERILTSDASDYIKEAAHNKYQEDSTAFTKLHMELADAFPELRQGTGLSAL